MAPPCCPVCQRVFSSRQALETHWRIHKGELPFACEVCGRRFRQSRHRDDHARTHTGERPYACQQCSCTFAHAQTLAQHQRMHAGVRRHACPSCPRRYGRADRLREHQLKVHGVPGQPRQVTPPRRTRQRTRRAAEAPGTQSQEPEAPLDYLQLPELETEGEVPPPAALAEREAQHADSLALAAAHDALSLLESPESDSARFIDSQPTDNMLLMPAPGASSAPLLGSGDGLPLAEPSGTEGELRLTGEMAEPETLTLLGSRGDEVVALDVVSETGDEQHQHQGQRSVMVQISDGMISW
ncbi:zinc finger protein 628-like [Amphibalanus amphitrite]|uniref:zinc finger protein 628-like n=1 Tax=Amphibalanus amphitrite TaxID=1232801 RepID=UPI001C901854|nr:zinc finger protein 628-like [Amphibalanus amphitrite]